jgi:glycosyltransferase involved in cell wall biosynthesis
VLDYADPYNATLIPFRPRVLTQNRIGELETVSQPWLVEPDENALVNALRNAAESRSTLQHVGVSPAAHVAEHWTWDAAASVVERRLTALVGTRS